ncbi:MULTISPECIES: hypothetical protein [unclassified Salegentibacter]|jgi:hypothetical protein|uniref:hypothetical protein n=1 Tax=unclassified Salegentibacter TaxID=2633436 RepID=UPI00056AC895|nr:MULTISPECIES: hypothetical protein [unclassified Salegentibacter]APS40242.1 hypothetical protein AO058_15730 [Salegentibacter sp. T436]
MKKITLVFLVLLSILPKNMQSQGEGEAIAAVAGGLLAIGAGVAAVEQMKEQAELTATQWILENQPNLESFSLKTLDFDGKKLKDMSSASVMTFKIQEFEPSDKPDLNGKKQILFGFTSYGWISEYGIDFTKVKWHLIDADEWMNMMIAYAKVSSDKSNENLIEETLRDGKIVNKGVKTRKGEDIPFYKLDGDMYLVTDYSPEMKIIYNEKSLGIFLKETRDLVQISRGAIIDIHEFFYEG